MVIAGYLIRLRTNEKGNPFYISAYLNSKHGKKTLVNMCKSIVGMANINAKELQRISIMIPPKSLQKKFEDNFTHVEKLIMKGSSQLIISNNLFNNLLQKAFNGELVA
jgi:type I restriction enzyme S subunit